MAKAFFRVLAAVVALIVLAAVWQVGIRPRLSLFQAWEGTIEESYRLRDADKDIFSPHRPEYLFYAHFWRVKCDDGPTLNVEVPYTLWQMGAAGMRVIKESGSRHPVLAANHDKKIQGGGPAPSPVEPPGEETVPTQGAKAETPAPKTTSAY